MKLFNWLKRNKGLVESTNISAGLYTPFIMSLNGSGFSYDHIQRNYPLLYQQFLGLGKSCMEFRAINFAQHKQIIYRQTAQTEYEEVELSHPAVEFLNNMNPEFDNFEMKQLNRLNQDVVGNCYWLIERNEFGYPKEFWNLRLSQNTSVEPISQNGVIVSYCYKDDRGKKVFYDVKDIIHFREMNPANPYIGFGKLAGNPYAFDMENNLNTYHKAYIENDATGRVYIKIDSDADFDQVQQQLSRINADFRGADKAGKLLGLANAEIKEISSTIKEMDYVETQKLYERKIISTFRVHPQLLGLTETVNKSNGISALGEWMNVHLKPIVYAYDIKLTKFIKANYKDAQNMFVKTIIEPPDDREQNLKELEHDCQIGALRYNQYLKLRGYDPIFKLDSRGMPTKELDPKGFEFVKSSKEKEQVITEVE
jgi:phage portal protein BeeE